MTKRRILATLAAALMLLAACGREGDPEEVSGLGDSSPTPSATVEADAEADETSEPGSTEEPEGGAATTSGPAATAAGSTATSGPVRTAAPGRASPPKDGTYTYTYEGKGNDPTNPAAGEQSFSGERYDKISHSGGTYTTETTTSEDAGRTTIKTRWTDTKVEMLEIVIESQAGTFSCRFDPPLVITKFPIKPETYPTQTFKGDGNACDGKLDITIVKKEDVKDAAGKAWSTWNVKVHTEIRPPNLVIIQDETRWVSPDIGVGIRSQGTQDGTFKSGATTFKFDNSFTSVLKKRP